MDKQIYATRLEQELAAMPRDDLRKVARADKVADVQRLSKAELVAAVVAARRAHADGERALDAAIDAATQDTPAVDEALGQSETVMNMTGPATSEVVAAPAPKSDGKRACQRARVITVLAEGNPKRAGTEAFKRFALYVSGMTVQAFLDAGGRSVDLAWDVAHKHIRLDKPKSV